MKECYIVKYFYDEKEKLRRFNDLHRLNIFIDRCLLEDVEILKVYRKEFSEDD